MDEYSGSDALDAGLLASAQAVEHYEMSRYGTLKTWAGQLGMKDAAGLLDQTLQEEKKTDARRSSSLPEGSDPGGPPRLSCPAGPPKFSGCRNATFRNVRQPARSPAIQRRAHRCRCIRP